MEHQKRAVCVHAHFYQPSRENPFTNTIDDEADSQPFSNWTEKIFHHCYKPNIDLGNFEYFNFNIGPTLTSWIKNNYPEYLKRIIKQEKRSFERFGSSNAIAQPYHHSILPLDTYQDKVTQIRWGIEDYRFHFNHYPEGMWLPETAVDNETLEIMANEGIIYTILAPWQAKQTELDITKPYYVKLHNNKQMIIFFYDSFLSGQVSFNPNITDNGDEFIKLLSASSNSEIEGQRDEKNHLTLIATDGELYGHHQAFRDKFISYVFHKLDQHQSIDIVNLGKWIKQHPPTDEIEILSNTSWSCHHGIERWKNVCDCTPNAVWKNSLRSAFNRLATKLNDIFEKEVTKYGKDPWELRNQYINVINNKLSIEDLLALNKSKGLSSAGYNKLSLLLKAQISRQRMFTSCGWFFDDIERIEPYYNIMHAAYAVYTTKNATSVDLYRYSIDCLHEVKDRSGRAVADKIFMNIYSQYAD